MNTPTPLKIAVITGASRGLGLALTQEFSTNGWHVIGTGRSPQPAGLPAETAYHQFDASNAAECQTFWEQLHSGHPSAQLCLVNNAGAYISGALTQTKPEDYEQQMKSSYFSSVFMTRGLALTYPAGRVINIVSTSALAPHKNDSAYGAAKAAQMHFFQSLQQEFSSGQYQITNIYPSDIATQGPNFGAIQPDDLAAFVRQQAESEATYYLRDVTMYPRRQGPGVANGRHSTRTLGVMQQQ